MIRLFEEIRDAFPRLSMRLDQEPVHVDLQMDIPEQPGLAFRVNLTPGRRTAPDRWCVLAGVVSVHPAEHIVAAYREAVHGLVNGDYRIREHYRGGRAFKAELQRPYGDGWQTIGTWYGWAWPVPRRTVEKVLAERHRRRDHLKFSINIRSAPLLTSLL